MGGTALDKDYKAIGKFSFASQRRNAKGLSSIEQNLMNARDSTTSLKFDGKLEAVVSSTTEIGKERFLTLLQRRVEEHGQETFYYMKDAHGTVVVDSKSPLSLIESEEITKSVLFDGKELVSKMSS